MSATLAAAHWRKWFAAIVILLVAMALAMAFSPARSLLARLMPQIGSVPHESTAAHKEGGATGHEGHDHSAHGHEGHGDANSLELSQQARSNIGLQLAKIELKPFERTVAIPGIIVERPGRSIIEVTAPLTGTVTRILPIRGEAVTPGEPLFELRLTHEDLVLAQRDYLRTAEELDVIQREIDRLEKLSADGAIAGKTLLERKYEKQKQEAALRAQHQALLLHGLSEEQVQKVRADRSLLQSLTVTVPANREEANDGTHVYQIEDMKVERGQYVNAGDTLAILTDHAELFIEGNAFEKDLAYINRAAEEGRSISAVLESEGIEPEIIPGLKILYLAGRVDPDSRAFHFYVTLPNTMLRDSKAADGHRFVYWRFKPGQRMQLQVPVERWTDRIVLPIDAIAQDGVETYVFQPNGKHFDRRPVCVEYRDQFWAVIANDGSLFPGEQVATTGAQQMQLALKNKAGGGIDPHAGHNH